MRYLIDTNVFLRTLIKEDEVVHKECKDLLRAVKVNKIKAVTSNLVLAEVMWTLLSFYNVERQVATESVRGIINLRGLKLIDGYRPLVALEMFMEKKVKFIDAMMASIPDISSRKVSVVSYDREFDKLGVVRNEPREVLEWVNFG